MPTPCSHSDASSVRAAPKHPLESETCTTRCRLPSVLMPVCGPVLPQIKGMKDRLEFWCTDVRSMEMLLEHQAHDILT